jgi:hypothetical protein
MASSFAAAFAKAGLVDPKKVEAEEKLKAKHLKAEERHNLNIAEERVFTDEAQAEKEEKHRKQAAHETTKPGHNSMDKRYLARFTDAHGRPVPQK